MSAPATGPFERIDCRFCGKSCARRRDHIQSHGAVDRSQNIRGRCPGYWVSISVAEGLTPEQVVEKAMRLFE